MPKYGPASIKNLATCHKDLQLIFNVVIMYIDCSIVEGTRGKELQNKYFDEGKSEIQWPHGKHNRFPSDAVDVYLYPVDWDDIDRMTSFAHFVLGVAAGLYEAKHISRRLRWGGDWDRDFDLDDQRFNDYPHFELY